MHLVVELLQRVYLFSVVGMAVSALPLRPKYQALVDLGLLQSSPPDGGDRAALSRNPTHLDAGRRKAAAQVIGLQSSSRASHSP